MDKHWTAQNFNIKDDELDATVWRYLTFPKFIHLISYEALWFCRLQHLIDGNEGHLPERALEQMRQENEITKKIIPTSGSSEPDRQVA